MPNWKKVIVSGSDAALNSLYVTGAVTASAISASYIDLDSLPLGSEPAYKEGRIFYSAEEGALSVYNSEADITLQVGQENWTRVRNNTGTTITNGTVVRIIGAQGDAPTIVRAQSIAKSGSINIDTQILGVATHDIEDNSFGYITTQGLVRGLNTNAFNDGETLFVGTGSAGVLQNTSPIAPYEIIPVGVCVKASPGGSGIIYVAVQQPLDFSDLSTVLVTGSYSYGDLWTYVASGSFGVWTHTNQLSGSYGITGSLTATSFTGSLLGTASYASNALSASYASNALSSSFATTSSYASNALSASYAISASHALNVEPTALAISYFNVSNGALADGTTYIIGQQTTLQTSANAVAHIPLPAGTITEAYIGVYNASTFASGENITVKFASDGGATTDTLSSTVTATSRHQEFIITGLSIPINAGRTFIMIECPTFATNPTSVQFRVTIKLEV